MYGNMRKRGDREGITRTKGTSICVISITAFELITAFTPRFQAIV